MSVVFGGVTKMRSGSGSAAEVPVIDQNAKIGNVRRAVIVEVGAGIVIAGSIVDAVAKRVDKDSEVADVHAVIVVRVAAGKKYSRAVADASDRHIRRHD